MGVPLTSVNASKRTLAVPSCHRSPPTFIRAPETRHSLPWISGDRQHSSPVLRGTVRCQPAGVATATARQISTAEGDPTRHSDVDPWTPQPSGYRIVGCTPVVESVERHRTHSPQWRISPTMVTRRSPSSEATTGNIPEDSTMDTSILQCKASMWFPHLRRPLGQTPQFGERRSRDHAVKSVDSGPSPWVEDSSDDHLHRFGGSGLRFGEFYRKIEAFLGKEDVVSFSDMQTLYG